MLKDDTGLGEVQNWVKLHNEAVSGYDIYLTEIETRLNYITIRRWEHYGTRGKKNAQKNEGDADSDERRVSDERRSQGR